MLPIFLLALIAGKYLLLTPVHGLADNGDFWRVMTPAGIEYNELPPRYQAFARELRISDSFLASSTTSAVLPTFFVGKLTSIFSDHLDLRLLGGFYLLVFVTGLAALTLSFGGWIFALGATWVSLEPTYFLHFNSFFSQALSFALWPWLLWALVKTLRRPEKKFPLALAGLALLIATSKLQFVLLPLWLLIALTIFPAGRRRFPNLLLAGTLALALAFSFLPNHAQTRGLKLMNRYHAVFTGLGAVANDPAQALRRLDIADSHHFLVGQGLMDSKVNWNISPDLAITLERLPLAQLAWVFVSTPGALVNSLPKLHEALARTPLQYLGNFEVNANLPGETLSLAWEFSRFRDSLLQFSPLFIWALVLIATLAAAWRSAGTIEWRAIAIFLLFHFLTQLPITAIGNGFYSSQRLLLDAGLVLNLLFWLLLDRLWGASSSHFKAYRG